MRATDRDSPQSQVLPQSPAPTSSQSPHEYFRRSVHPFRPEQRISQPSAMACALFVKNTGGLGGISIRIFSIPPNSHRIKTICENRAYLLCNENDPRCPGV